MPPQITRITSSAGECRGLSIGAPALATHLDSCWEAPELKLSGSVAPQGIKSPISWEVISFQCQEPEAQRTEAGGMGGISLLPSSNDSGVENIRGTVS